MTLHRDVLNGDVTQHVTHGYPAQSCHMRGRVGLLEASLGENHFAHDHFGDAQCNQKYFVKNEERRSTDVDDDVISSDGDYEIIKQNLDIETKTVSCGDGNNHDQTSDLRLSRAESTDSGMGFCDNSKDVENSRLSDGYGTIHLVGARRKSLLDGDAEYDEVREFISAPKDRENRTPSSVFEKPQKKDGDVGGAGDSASKYEKLDLAKILHTKRRHRHTSTLGRGQTTTEEKAPEEGGLFNSLKRKTKSKNYSISAYATYGRNRKSSQQQKTGSSRSRLSSTGNNDNTDVVFPLAEPQWTVPPSPTDPTSNYSSADNPHYAYTFDTRRNHFSSDFAMTADVNNGVLKTAATVDRTSERSKPKSPSTITENFSSGDRADEAHRWSWQSNSPGKRSHEREKSSTASKSPWKILRLLMGSKHKNAAKDRPVSNASPRTRPRSASLFRRLSTRKSNRNRRNSAPAKDEFFSHFPSENGGAADLSRPAPVFGAEKRRPVAPRALTQKSYGRRSARLMSFRKSRNPKGSEADDPTPKGLCISPPQLAVNAIDPTRNYSEHQLLNLKDLTIRSELR